MTSLDWSKLPDLIAVGLLALGFASVARRSNTPVSADWLNGWLLIELHFLAFMCIPLPGFWGNFAATVGTLALVWTAILFMRASIPYRSERSSKVMFWTLQGTFSLYIVTLMYSGPEWLLEVSAVLVGLGPLLVAVLALPGSKYAPRALAVALQCALAIWLLAVQRGPGGADLALNGVLFTVYLSTSLVFWMAFRRATAGAIITISGFFLWASVFPIGTWMAAHLPSVHVENEVWNLPKFVVAVGMILLLLEDQIAHNKHLALHDELTGLPNRRLFQDRLSIAMERARRTGTQTALLTIDLDHFKQVNDTLGHHAGDLLLQNVARLFASRVRRSDTVARTGGDEFAVILDSPTTAAEALVVGHSLLDLLTEPMSLKDRMVNVGASIGMAIFPADAEDIESLCIKADLRMYEDKRSHRGEDHEEREATFRRSRPNGVTLML